MVCACSRRNEPSLIVTPDLRFNPPEFLEERRLHVWCFDMRWLQCLDGLDEVWLSPDERERRRRIGDITRALYFARTRSAVRGALASYFGQDPAALRFTYGTHGKPSLVGGEGLEFSVSHSRGAALLAVANRTPLGVDLERSVVGRRDDLAERVLGPAGLAVYRRLPPQARAKAFSLAWSEREAYIKAIGLGIGDGWTTIADLFSEFSLLVDPQPAGWREIGGRVLHYVEARPGYGCVVCADWQASHIDLLDVGLRLPK